MANTMMGYGGLQPQQPQQPQQGQQAINSAMPAMNTTTGYIGGTPPMNAAYSSQPSMNAAYSSQPSMNAAYSSQPVANQIQVDKYKAMSPEQRQFYDSTMQRTTPPQIGPLVPQFDPSFVRPQIGPQFDTRPLQPARPLNMPPDFMLGGYRNYLKAVGNNSPFAPNGQPLSRHDFRGVRNDIRNSLEQIGIDPRRMPIDPLPPQYVKYDPMRDPDWGGHDAAMRPDAMNYTSATQTPDQMEALRNAHLAQTMLDQQRNQFLGQQQFIPPNAGIAALPMDPAMMQRLGNIASLAGGVRR